MNKFVILTVFLFAIAFVNAEDKKASSSSEENIRDFAEIIQKKFNTTIVFDAMRMAEQAKANCPDIEEKVEGVAEKVVKCMEDVELGSETFCSIINKNFGKCSKPAVDLIVSCLPKESQDLPAMTEKMFLAVLNQACHSTVEEMLELLNPCAMEKDFASFPACTDIKKVADENKSKFISKALVCSMLPKAKSCAQAHQEASCKNPITKQVVMKFHDAIDASVKDDCAALNTV